jgi:WD40 repeat protein
MAAELLRCWTEHHSVVQSVAFRPNSHLLASCAHDGLVCLWEWKTGQLIWKWEFLGALFGVAFSPDGRQLAVGGEGAVWMCNLPPHSPPTRPIVCTGEVVSLAFCPNGQRFVIGSTDGTAYLWDPQKQLLLAKLDHDDEVHSVAFSPDSRLLATATQDGWLSLWEAQNGHRLAPAFHESAWLTSTTFSPDGHWIACGLETGEVVVIALATGQVVWRHEAHQRPILSLAFSPDSQVLVTGGGDATVRFWHVPQWRAIPGLRCHQLAVTGIACAPLDGVPGAFVLATSSRDATVCCWGVYP